ncbi:MAG: hypothetical protein ABR575_09450 [Actinomycetota bacterium]
MSVGPPASSPRPAAVGAGAALLLLGLWSVAAPYAGRALGFEVNTRPSVEVVDHVVPGIVVIAIAVGVLLTGGLALAAALAAVLAGFWMTATHVPLLVQANEGGVAMSTALWHTVPGVASLVVAGVLAVGAWRRAGEIEQA